jgi:hypothetical protein
VLAGERGVQSQQGDATLAARRNVIRNPVV